MAKQSKLPPMRRLCDDEGRVITGPGPSCVDVMAIWRGEFKQTLPTVAEVRPGLALCYKGCTNLITGETGGGKSMVSLLTGFSAVLYTTTTGETKNREVIYVGAEDVAVRMLMRAKALGAPDEWAENLTYSDQPSAEALDHLILWARDLAAAGGEVFFVLDGLHATLRRAGISENDNDEVGEWIMSRMDVLANAGAAVLITDHFGKVVGEDARHAKGAGVKLNLMSGACYKIVSAGRFSPTVRGEDGRVRTGKKGGIRLVVTKDRHGGLGVAEGDNIASCTFWPEGVGNTRFEWQDLRDGAGEADGKDPLEAVKTNILTTLSKAKEGYTKRAAMRAGKKGNDSAADALGEMLSAEEGLIENKGTKGAWSLWITQKGRDWLAKLGKGEENPSAIDLDDYRRQDDDDSDNEPEPAAAAQVVATA